MTANTGGDLIATEHVNGTDVYSTKGDNLGYVEDVMIDQSSGKAIYAIMSFGGFLGMGEKQHPSPWSTLKYERRQGGYLVDLDKKTLEDVPTYEGGDFRRTPDYGRKVDMYYDVPTCWL
ncbi:MAG: PRC-barrel domain-containing protein [Rhodospirillales bacterium]|nr:MAG: PRC-barrel domain-containing protein [Rhodospirillales bacterium]